MFSAECIVSSAKCIFRGTQATDDVMLENGQRTGGDVRNRFCMCFVLSRFESSVSGC